MASTAAHGPTAHPTAVRSPATPTRLTRAAAWVAVLLLAFAVVPAVVHPTAARADNPIVQHDLHRRPGAAGVQRPVYLYTGHDEDGSTYFTMKDWRVWSSADMVNWTDHGSPMSLATFSWAKSDAWAGQAVDRNGKFYWYVPVTDRATGRMAIGVASRTAPPDRSGTPSATRWSRTARSTHGLHRRRRPGVPVLGQPQPVVRQAERRT